MELERIENLLEEYSDEIYKIKSCLVSIFSNALSKLVGDAFLSSERELNLYYKDLVAKQNYPDYLENDIFLLRYAISYKKQGADAAADAINRGLIWRMNYPDFYNMALNAIESDLFFIHKGNDPNFIDPAHYERCFPKSIAHYIPIIRKLLVAWHHKETTTNQPVVLCRIGLCNISAIIDFIEPSVVKEYILFCNEVEFWCCHKKTVQSGYFHRCLRLIDLSKVSFKTSSILDKRFMNIFRDTSKCSEYLHPQLVGHSWIINAPSFVSFVFDAMKVLGISSRALNKIVVVKNFKKSGIFGDKRLCMELRKADIPSFFGGDCKCQYGCIPGISNDCEQAYLISDDETKALSQLNEKTVGSFNYTFFCNMENLSLTSTLNCEKRDSEYYSSPDTGVGDDDNYDVDYLEACDYELPEKLICDYQQ